MEQKRLYIIAGCNGAGKTTASFNILPELLQCKEFVNADEIARGISPFQPEKVSIEAGRIMLNRIEELVANKETFAFETTLATRSFPELIRSAKGKGYMVNLIYFWLDSVELAIERVNYRVLSGGHFIPEEVIRRRYVSGLKNLFNIYLKYCDVVLFFDNSGPKADLILEYQNQNEIVHNIEKYTLLKKQLK